jgi:polyisoprenoid-binding protein YceI
MTERSRASHRPSGPRRTASPSGVVLVIVAVLALAVIAGGFYLFGRSAPAPVGLDPFDTAPSSATAGSAGSASPGTSIAPLVSAPPTAALDGTWTVDPTIGGFVDFSGSFAGYRVREVLVGIGAATAVGRTPDVSGSIVVVGTTVTQARFEVDLRTLRSDSSARDGQLRRQGLETDRFPTASFVVAEPVELGRQPAVGEIIRVEAVGDLTIHGVTRRVTFPLEGRLNADGTLTVAGSLEVAFADFGITAPESFRVLSVEPRATIELQLQLRRA